MVGIICSFVHHSLVLHGVDTDSIASSAVCAGGRVGCESIGSGGSGDPGTSRISGPEYRSVSSVEPHVSS